MEGDDLAIIGIGSMVWPAFEAGKTLRSEGIRATVVNARFARPLDNELILSLARRTRRLIVAEENAKMGGFGSSILELLAEHGLSGVQVKLFGVPDHFIEHGAPDILRRICGLTTEDFCAAGRQMVGRTQTILDEAVVILK